MNISTGNVMLGLRLGPKTGIIHSEKFIPRIKPMYYLTNAEIRSYSESMDFPVLYDPCPCAVDSFRHLVRRHLKTLEAERPGTKRQIVDTFREMIPIVKGYYKPGKGVKICEICGEPSSKAVCKTCELIELLR
jgi:tRNA-5-methyluridine54 2-sulfurtransferase